MKNWVLGAVALPLALLAQSANAAPILYTITGDFQASFIIDDHPTVKPLASDPEYFFTDPTDEHVFYISNIAGTFNGQTAPGIVAPGNFVVGLTFYDGVEGGGLTITLDSSFNDPNGSLTSISPISPLDIVLFSGVVSAPTLLTFGPTTFDDFDAPGTKSYTISAQAVPEPASWALMIGGLGLVGATMRRRNGAKVSCA